ncbi:hypothetical protein QTO34_010218 [Cnephaeus nilssonii]|uniref:Uncharacterized protein n=1 Tax=Cnephaeus nilssonii TaxID=3371016 RepID=A0AA40HF41_CNENI|nr:hypothetical protein QTO34_010218 [Eptesicus nilssonii]
MNGSARPPSVSDLPGGRERDRELETSMIEKHRSAASCTTPTGDVPTTKSPPTLCSRIPSRCSWGSTGLRTETLQPLKARGCAGYTDLLPPWICHFLAVWPRRSDCSSLSLRPSTCPVREIAPTSFESLHIQGEYNLTCSRNSTKESWMALGEGGGVCAVTSPLCAQSPHL